MLAEKSLTMAVVESATAGRLAYEFSQTECAGKILKGGVVCYDACIKQDLLGIPEALIKKYTPESAEVTKAIAQNLKKVIPADIYVGVTGLPKPGGSETPEKPVGTMFIHLVINEKNIADRSVFKGDPESIVMQAIDRTARLILDHLS